MKQLTGQNDWGDTRDNGYPRQGLSWRNRSVPPFFLGLKLLRGSRGDHPPRLRFGAAPRVRRPDVAVGWTSLRLTMPGTGNLECPGAGVGKDHRQERCGDIGSMKTEIIRSLPWNH
ncbi:MAG: hypothetical protein HW380_309 [Magnetococcales bacterium]|nr:hypothetical protein [Magnetococcales bacterium]